MEAGLGSKPHSWAWTILAMWTWLSLLTFNLPVFIDVPGIQETAPSSHTAPVSFDSLYQGLAWLLIHSTSLLFSLESNFAKQVEEFPLKDLHWFMLPSLFINGTTFSLIFPFPSDVFVKALLLPFNPMNEISWASGFPSLSFFFPSAPTGMHFCLLPYTLLLRNSFKYF